MGYPSSPQVLPSPPLHIPTSNLPMLYYGLVIVGTAAVILILYNLVIIRCNSRLMNQPSNQRMSRNPGPTQDRAFNMNYVYSFKYKKEAEEEENEYECAVCLSVFEEGEQLRQLPNCKHSFHATCIDMWLYSHFDCPLCRTSAVEPVAEHSREGLLAPGALL